MPVSIKVSRCLHTPYLNDRTRCVQPSLELMAQQDSTIKEKQEESKLGIGSVILCDTDWCSKTFGELLDDPSTHDVTFKTSDGGSVSGHRAIVAAGSPVFHAMLYGSMKESNEKEIKLSSVDTKTFSNLLRFLYTGKIKVDQECFEGVLDAARFFNITSVEAKVADFIAKSLDNKNFYLILNIAINKNFDQLLEHCLTHLYANANELVCSPSFSTVPAEVVLTLCKSSDLDIKEIDLFLALVEWHSHKKSEVSEDVIKSIFQEVRYPLISKDDLYNKVRPTEVADSSLYTAALEYYLFPKKYDGPSIQITGRQSIIPKVAFTNLTPNMVTMTESPKGTTFTKVGKSAWNGMCLAEVHPTNQHPVHFKFRLVFCSSYNGVRLGVQSCSLNSIVISSPAGMTVDGIAVDQEVDGLIAVDGNTITTTIGGTVMKARKQDAIYLCLYMFHTNSSVRISILDK